MCTSNIFYMFTIALHSLFPLCLRLCKLQYYFLAHLQAEILGVIVAYFLLGVPSYCFILIVLSACCEQLSINHRVPFSTRRFEAMDILYPTSPFWLAQNLQNGLYQLIMCSQSCMTIVHSSSEVIGLINIVYFRL